MTTTTETKSLKLAIVAALALGTPLEGGTYHGIYTQKDGTQVAIVRLADKPSGRMTHAEATAWAESVGGVLPSRVAGAILYANAKDQFEPTWYWTCESLDADTGDEDDASYAWLCHFGNGTQGCSSKSAHGAAVAVRLIHLEV